MRLVRTHMRCLHLAESFYTYAIYSSAHRLALEVSGPCWSHEAGVLQACAVQAHTQYFSFLTFQM